MGILGNAEGLQSSVSPLGITPAAIPQFCPAIFSLYFKKSPKTFSWSCSSSFLALGLGGEVIFMGTELRQRH